MGSALSIFDPKELEDPTLGNHDRPIFEYFGFTKFDVATLRNVFDKLGKDKKGKVKVKSILKHYKIKRSPFMERVFSLLNLQSISTKASVDHKTFIYLLWNFLSIGLHLPDFAMSLYDIQRTGKLTRNDVHTMMKDIHGYKLEYEHKDFTRAILAIEENDGLRLDDFKVFVLKNKVALEPISSLKETISIKTLGKDRWAQLALKRQNRWEGSFVDIYDILSDMKENTGCTDQIITLDQFTHQIERNLKYLAEVEAKKEAKKNSKKNSSEEESTAE